MQNNAIINLAPFGRTQKGGSVLGLYGKGVKRMANAQGLKITMLGDFSIAYNGVPLKLERTNTTKAMQALQVLIYYGEAGLPRNVFMDTLYSRDDNITDPANNLKVTVSNLRRLLARAGLPDSTTIQFQSGSYYWKSDLPMELDIAVFQQQIEHCRGLQGETLAAELEKACALYTGDFLPHLQAEDWVMAAAVHYREQYFKCVRVLANYWQEKADYNHLLEVAAQAAALYPLEEWKILHIESLIAMERYQEAKAVYEDAVAILQKEYDVTPSQRLQDCLRRIDRSTESKNVTINELQELLQEEETADGAYYCSLPSFIDTYRVVSRILERNGQSAYLMLCWMVDSKGQLLKDKEKTAAAGKKVSEAIGGTLRRGDTYTRPGMDRFLVLLMGTNLENCSIVSARIDANYRKKPARGVSLRYKLAPVSDASSAEMFREKPFWK